MSDLPPPSTLPDGRVLAFDFDGVIWDSVDEAGAQAWTAWHELHGALPLTLDAFRILFRRARWQAKDGHDFYLVMQALAETPARCAGDLSGTEFEALRQAMRADPAAREAAEAFVHAFYRSRARMRDGEPAAWMALQQAYPGIPEALKRLRHQVQGLAIATTKDAHSARLLLASAGLDGLTIHGRETSLDKADHMRAIAAEHGIATSQITFIDDLLENLLPLGALGVDRVLAGWGYNTPAEQARARALGIRVATLETMEAVLLAAAPSS